MVELVPLDPWVLLGMRIRHHFLVQLDPLDPEVPLVLLVPGEALVIPVGLDPLDPEVVPVRLDPGGPLVGLDHPEDPEVGLHSPEGTPDLPGDPPVSATRPDTLAAEFQAQDGQGLLDHQVLDTLYPEVIRIGLVFLDLTGCGLNQCLSAPGTRTPVVIRLSPQ